MLNPRHFTREHRRRALICQKDSISPHVIPTGNNSDNGKNRWKRVEHCRADYEQWWSHSGRDLVPSPSGSGGHVHLLDYHCTHEPFLSPEHHSKLIRPSRKVHKVHMGMHCEMWTAFSEQVLWFWFVKIAPQDQILKVTCSSILITVIHSEFFRLFL